MSFTEDVVYAREKTRLACESASFFYARTGLPFSEIIPIFSENASVISEEVASISVFRTIPAWHRNDAPIVENHIGDSVAFLHPLSFFTLRKGQKNAAFRGEMSRCAYSVKEKSS